jgi:hypothetical protein
LMIALRQLFKTDFAFWRVLAISFFFTSSRHSLALLKQWVHSLYFFPFLVYLSDFSLSLSSFSNESCKRTAGASQDQTTRSRVTLIGSHCFPLLSSFPFCSLLLISVPSLSSGFWLSHMNSAAARANFLKWSWSLSLLPPHQQQLQTRSFGLDVRRVVPRLEPNSDDDTSRTNLLFAELKLLSL